MNHTLFLLDYGKKGTGRHESRDMFSLTQGVNRTGSCDSVIENGKLKMEKSVTQQRGWLLVLGNTTAKQESADQRLLGVPGPAGDRQGSPTGPG